MNILTAYRPLSRLNRITYISARPDFAKREMFLGQHHCLENISLRFEGPSDGSVFLSRLGLHQPFSASNSTYPQLSTSDRKYDMIQTCQRHNLMYYLITMSWKSIRGPYRDPTRFPEFPTTAHVLQRSRPGSE